MRCAILATCVGLSAGLIAAAGCKKSDDSLPVATDWQSAPAAGEAAQGAPPAMRSDRTGNPHAGLDMTGQGGQGDEPGDPHAGLDMSGDGTSGEGDDGDPAGDSSHRGGASDPHAGLGLGAMGGKLAGGDPHAGLDMSGQGGTDVTRMGLAAPDPDRPIDPTHRVAGTIVIDAKARDRVKPGTSVFLIVKRAGPDGAPSGPPLAVDKLTWTGSGMAFELTDEQAMVAGTDLSGSVVVMARYDQDSDALTKQPGDVTGQVRVTVPAEHVKLMLDTVLP